MLSAYPCCPHARRVGRTLTSITAPLSDRSRLFNDRRESSDLSLSVALRGARLRCEREAVTSRDLERRLLT